MFVFINHPSVTNEACDQAFNELLEALQPKWYEQGFIQPYLSAPKTEQED
jgi:hypothetical protein